VDGILTAASITFYVHDFYLAAIVNYHHR
jgi:hypothetical protein